ncbi:MAG: hypothetical protein KJ808_02215 [Acidobacteria bacterium]|nr:hypothetical protein [Acidobacteriota bacterium]MBU4306287.1 hypothetical protein [Acidobacteriota bacterium]MBU4408631.1 hypothetical protein [Pseudomonadota bacterium]MCG2812354.1 hypothetical protein [Candidatus Aminicenantes bacterium]
MENETIQQNLHYIKQIMADSRQTFVDNGLGLIGWGILCVTGIIVMYVCMLFQISLNALILWVAVVLAGFLWTLTINRRLRRQYRSCTFAYKMMRAVWLVCSLALMIVGFVGFYRIDVQILPALFAIIMGIGIALSGMIMGRRLIVGCAGGWWLGAILMFLFPWKHHFLVFAGLMVVFAILPGIALYSSWKKELQRKNP